MNTGKFFKNSYFEEYLRAAASAPDRNILKKSKPVNIKACYHENIYIDFNGLQEIWSTELTFGNNDYTRMRRANFSIPPISSCFRK